MNIMLESCIKAINELAEIFEKAFDKTFREALDYLDNITETLSNIKYKEKVKFKPILKMIPTKIYWRDKRSFIYHCRNNC